MTIEVVLGASEPVVDAGGQQSKNLFSFLYRCTLRRAGSPSPPTLRESIPSACTRTPQNGSPEANCECTLTCRWESTQSTTLRSLRRRNSRISKCAFVSFCCRQSKSRKNRTTNDTGKNVSDKPRSPPTPESSTGRAPSSSCWSEWVSGR